MCEDGWFVRFSCWRFENLVRWSWFFFFDLCCWFLWCYFYWSGFIYLFLWVFCEGINLFVVFCFWLYFFYLFLCFWWFVWSWKKIFLRGYVLYSRWYSSWVVVRWLGCVVIIIFGVLYVMIYGISFIDICGLFLKKGSFIDYFES